MKYRIVTAFSEDRGRLSVFFDQREGGEDREPSPVLQREGGEDREPSPVFASPAFRITATLIVLALPHGA